MVDEVRFQIVRVAIRPQEHVVFIVKPYRTALLKFENSPRQQSRSVGIGPANLSDWNVIGWPLVLIGKNAYSAMSYIYGTRRKCDRSTISVRSPAGLNPIS